MTTAAAGKIKRDYSLVGESTRRAVETGLASAEWYHTDDPAQGDEGTDAALRRAGDPRHDHLARLAMIVSAAGGIYFWGTWWCVPFFLVYGVLYGSASDSRWHECGHGTAFKTRWMNDVVYQIASLHADAQSGHLALEPCPPSHRHDHRRPRRRDRRDAPAGPAEGRADLHRPARPALFAADLFRQRLGSLNAEEKSYIPEMEQRKAIVAARWHVAIYVATIALALCDRGHGCR